MGCSIQNLTYFFENTRACDRPDGPMRAKEKFNVKEIASFHREIAQDHMSISPVPFTREQFWEYCDKHRADAESPSPQDQSSGSPDDQQERRRAPDGQYYTRMQFQE